VRVIISFFNDFLTIISVFVYMCLYLHTDMYVEHINTRGHERICPYQIIEKNTLNAANL